MIAARVASHAGRPSARNGFSAGAANVPSGTGSVIAERSIASSCSRTTQRGSPPGGAATPYGRLSGPKLTRGSLAQNVLERRQLHRQRDIDLDRRPVAAYDV